MVIQDPTPSLGRGTRCTPPLHTAPCIRCPPRAGSWAVVCTSSRAVPKPPWVAVRRSQQRGVGVAAPGCSYCVRSAGARPPPFTAARRRTQGAAFWFVIFPNARSSRNGPRGSSIGARQPQAINTPSLYCPERSSAQPVPAAFPRRERRDPSGAERRRGAPCPSAAGPGGAPRSVSAASPRCRAPAPPQGQTRGPG